MLLADYLARKGIKRIDFARQIGKSPSYITRLTNGTLRPGWDALDTIINVTNGEVSRDDFKRYTGARK
jgi:transcriptional regulator with XRE-family HTH domain